MVTKSQNSLISRIADALDRLAPLPPKPVNLARSGAFVWHASPPALEPVAKVNRVELQLLKGIDQTRDTLGDTPGGTIVLNTTSAPLAMIRSTVAA